ncbi:MAG: hypothetical protein RJB31_2051 [Bacteroidota bacterium]
MMNPAKASILLVEDEENLLEALKLNLELEGYEVTCAMNGAIALKKVEEEYYDLILLDVMLPEVDGFDVCETIRLNNIDTPILMLSARSGSVDRRVDKLIEKNRRFQEKTTLGEQYAFGGNSIDFKAQTATNQKGDFISLSKKEIMLLKLMIEYRNEVVSREKILQSVWGYQVFPTTRTIDNFILNFRKYFETDPREPQHFHSIRGVGYKFTDA